MSKIVISVNYLSKAYRLGVINHGMLYKDIQSWWARLRGKEDPNSVIGMHNQEQMDGEDRFWALKDIDFEVNQGDRIGIIGKNGAGKSTLLKILSRVTAPTKGSVKVKGSIASLLEVGTGFHPELTGRENVFLNGAILGMSKQEIHKKFDEIVDFAGIEKFIDTPVKRYSSGMYVRLAFAVAAHLEPEILVVDEVLAVGDAEFQKKAIGKMEDVSKGEGRTILFVSHNMGAVKKLCERAILLKAGSIAYENSTQSVVDVYLQEAVPTEKLSCIEFERDDNKRLQLLSARMLNENEENVSVFSCDSPFYIELQIYVSNKVMPGDYGLLSINNQENLCVLTSDTNDVEGHSLDKLNNGINRLLIKIPERSLAAGPYTVYFRFNDNAGIAIDYPSSGCHFNLDDIGTYRGNKRDGYFSTLLSWILIDRKDN